MSKQFVQNKYNAGDAVFAKVNPSIKLIIRRYVDQIYYCKVKDSPDSKDLVYFERELVDNPLLTAKNEKERLKSII